MKNRKLLLPLVSLLLPVVAAADIQILPQDRNSPTVYMDYSANLKNVFIIKRKPQSKRSADMDIYSVDSKLMPQAKLYTSTKSMITDAVWSGNQLLFLEVNGFGNLEDYISGRKKSFLAQGPSAIQNDVFLRSWPPTKSAFDQVKIDPDFSFIFRSADKIFILGELYDEMGYWNPKIHKFNGKLYSERSLRIYDAKTGELKKKLILPLSIGPSRWWNRGSNGWLPLFTVENGSQLVIIAENTDFWRLPSAYEGAYLVKIDLSSGAFKVLNSEAEGQGTMGRKPAVGDLGNPVQLSNGNIMCLLDTSTMSEHVVFRFGQYEPSGKKVQDIYVTDSEFTKAGVSSYPFFVTWTQDGSRAIVQDENKIWLYDLAKKTSGVIATGFQVSKVGRWLDSDRLLVQVQPYDSKTKDVSDETSWAILQINSSKKVTVN